MEVHAGRTPEIIRLAHSCLAVSGSVGLELLYQGTPSVVVYRIGRLDLHVCRLFKTSRFISLVNLLAGRELFPEYLTDHCQAEAMSRDILNWLNDPEAVARLREEMAGLRRQVAEPGACARAAEYVLETLAEGGTRRRAA